MALSAAPSPAQVVADPRQASDVLAAPAEEAK